ncbi:MAG TPA: enoyl-CoA hydratase-related protein [Alphaproteobacteria bacterium]|nr:enoyl-CoA hydratase-related protein [Alphaproteobacteria bacterium]
MADGLEIQRNGAVLDIRLDRPKANAIDAATSRAMSQAFEDFQRDEALRVAILSGAGERFFCAGWDLKAVAAGEADEDFGSGGFGGLMANFALDKPVIAALNGMAVGGGFEIVLACDFVVMAEHAECFLTEIRLGFLSDAASIQRLLHRLPRNVALEILLAGRRLGAAEARALGLANVVCPGPSVLDEARALAGRLAQGAPLPLRAAKRIVRAVEAESDEAAAHAMAQGPLKAAYEAIFASEDFREGPLAFFERRAPVWKGR